MCMLVYFISRGSVQFVTGTAKGIFSVSQGTYFGEIELLEGVLILFLLNF